MPKHRVLSLKPHLRLDWRGQDGQDETQKPDHFASLDDSITSSTRMRFSVHSAALVKAQKVGCWWVSRNPLLSRSITDIDLLFRSGSQPSPTRHLISLLSYANWTDYARASGKHNYRP